MTIDGLSHLSDSELRAVAQPPHQKARAGRRHGPLADLLPNEQPLLFAHKKDLLSAATPQCALF